MLKKTIFTYLILISSFNVNSQEILCNVRVNSSQVQISDRKIFQSMQTAIYEFINNTKWTNANISSEERIECSILINISNKISNDEYEGSMQIQSTRPIYGTSYKSTLFYLLMKYTL